MMSLRWALRLVWLICAVSPVYGFSCREKQDLEGEMNGCGSNQSALFTASMTVQATDQNVLACCGEEAYNPVNEICCDSAIRVKPAVKSKCCGKEAINEDKQLCCQINKTITRTSSLYQCCGSEEYNTETHCCDNELQIKPFGNSSITSRRLTDDCEAESKIWTDQHYCGPKVFRPEKEICCSGHRYNKAGNDHCCGVKAYNITDPKMKCCAGTLHRLTAATANGECCGSILYTEGVCCLSEDKEVFYSAKTDFRCCGHLYYNTSLWSCCAGKLRPRKSGVFHNSTILSLNKLNQTQLCNPIKIGTVESVSQHSIVFSSLLEINGQIASLKPLDWHYSWNKPYLPELTPGKTYFFNDDNVFIDFNHDSLLQSIRFIISKC
ncbi:galaxin isoform X1 [Oreochromis niloticus]|uniref:galaxin isoform X1 n=1 Tax=Oreochromis niloticus TaxID=8128 RepID=UPI0003941FDC|nr:galaxin isoform X1 [Oreochromis niloticus]